MRYSGWGARRRRAPCNIPEADITVLTAREIFELVREDLVRVEQELAAQNAQAIAPVAEISSYLLEGGGKRLRPALLLMAAGVCGYRGAGAIRLGAVVELIHTATLVHDDVIDEADTRRGRASANSRWGNHRSVLAGDWLYMQSFQMAVRERNFRILDILIELTQNMVEGELLQLDILGRIDLSEREALDLAYRKTACLFSGCTHLGAVLGQPGTHVERALCEYGRLAGLAFQLVDDVLDFTASPSKLGKPVLNDLIEGKVTLPLIYALDCRDGDARQMVGTVLAEQGFHTVRPEQIAELVHDTGSLERTRRLAQEYATRAKALAGELADNDFRRALLAVPDFVLDRES